MNRVRAGIEKLCECEKCFSIFERENENETICQSCNDPEIAKKEAKRLKKSRYLNRK